MIQAYHRNWLRLPLQAINQERNEMGFPLRAVICLLTLWVSITASGATVAPAEIKSMKQLISDGKFHLARALLDKNLTAGTGDPAFRLVNAQWLRFTGHTDEAITEYQTAASLAPLDAEPLVALAELYLQDLQLDESLRCSRLALQLDPKSIAARLAYATALLKSDQTAEGERQVSRLVETEAQNPEVQLLVYQLGRKKGDFESARQALEFVIAKSPKGDPHWELELADLQEAEGDISGARRRLEELLAVDDSSIEARIRLGRLLEFRFHDFGAAAACYNHVIKKFRPPPADATNGSDRCRRKQRDIALRMKSTIVEMIRECRENAP